MTKLPDIIGQPPTGPTSYELTYNSLPIIEIEPKKPQFETAATLFTLVSDWNSYEDLLEEHEFSLVSKPLKLAFIADNFPTDTFTNQYSESFLNRFTDLVSSGAAELAQITGQRSAGEAVKSMLNAMSKSDVGLVSAFGEGAKGALGAAKGAFQSVASGMGAAGSRIGKIAEMTGKLLGGARVDMPMIWKNSGFTPSYTITVRLYNPQPSNPIMKEKYIVGPIAAILLLALPQTEDGVYYNWPFFCTIKVPGLLYIPSAYIGNITLVKGGDQQQISYSQEMGVVDVRIEFGSLYDTMIAGLSYQSDSRPTLKNYLDNMRDKKSIFHRDEVGGGSLPFPEDILLKAEADARLNQGSIDVTSEPSDRVSTTDYNDAVGLLDNQPTIA